MTQQKPTGGQAFPRSAREGVPGNEWKGMTLRDYFAGQALIGLVTLTGPAKQIAEMTYEFADAMIAARDS